MTTYARTEVGVNKSLTLPGYSLFRPGPRDYPYGMRDFEVSDLGRNQLSFGTESRK